MFIDNVCFLFGVLVIILFVEVIKFVVFCESFLGNVNIVVVVLGKLIIKVIREIIFFEIGLIL